MFLKLPGSEEKIFWTNHSKAKMNQYALSEKRVLRVLRKPERKEEGIAPKTLAAMQVTGTKKYPTEIWMMYQKIKAKAKAKGLIINIISAWRYPGRTPLGARPIIPEDALEELIKLTKNSC